MMKGYVVNDGYMGYVNGRYMLFSCEEDYREYMSEECGDCNGSRYAVFIPADSGYVFHI